MGQIDMSGIMVRNVGWQAGIAKITDIALGIIWLRVSLPSKTKNVLRCICRKAAGLPASNKAHPEPIRLDSERNLS